jgi:uncharacterized protein DUF2510
MATVRPQPGWYTDPADASWQRYWDGTAWTIHRRPLPPPGEPSREQATSWPKRVTEWFDTGTAAVRFAKAVTSLLVALGLIAGGGIVINTVVNGSQTHSDRGTTGRGQSGGQGTSGGGQGGGNRNGYLNNIPQTPSFRQGFGPITYNGIQYAESFQLDIPGGGSAKYSYALDGQWSEIKLLTEVPQGGNGGAILGVTVSIDGHQASGGNFELGVPYSSQFSVAGIKTLTISFNAAASLSANTIVVAGNLSR